MSRPMPRSVYVRRRLLLLAGVLLLAWAVVRFWPGDSSEDRVTTKTVATPAAEPSAKPTESASPAAPRARVTLARGGKSCDAKLVKLTPAVPDSQHARDKVAIDLAVSTTSKKPCVLKPKSYNPLIVIERDAKDVWDSSLCKKALLTKPIQLSPDWSTTVRAMWTPRESGKECDKDEDWVDPGTYTLRIGMLGGEPASVKFKLSKPAPKPKPTETPTEKSKSDKKSSAEKKAADKKKSDSKKSDREKSAESAEKSDR